MKNYLYILLIFLIVSCGKDDTSDVSEYVSFSIPQGFPKATYSFLNNNIKSEKAVFELGRKLFYEPKLSSDNSISCAECHNQPFAFTHHGHALSTGVQEAIGIRNTQPLQNLAFQKSFTWNGVETQLWRQPIIPIGAENEMNESFENIQTKLKGNDQYLSMFQSAYNDGSINTVNILKAIGNFMGMMVSSNSKYDQYLRGEKEGEFTNIELSGLKTFEQKCASCHNGILFTDESFRNNGLLVNIKIPNETGREEITKNPYDFYKFKVPSLRNIEKTFPYMHDGRISTLRGVLNHYDSGVKNNSSLDPSLKNGDTLGIPLTEDEKDGLIAFLKTLTDYEFLNDDRFAEPN